MTKPKPLVSGCLRQRRRNSSTCLVRRDWFLTRHMPSAAAKVIICVVCAEREHEWCHPEFHRCDGGGKGEYERYVSA